jgi:cytoskeletal protein CcmA (bactofilin family)
MFGRRKDNDGTHKTGPDAPAPATESTGPRMYRADSAMAPVPRAPVVESTRRVPDVMTTASRRPDSRPSPASDSDGKKLIVGREIVLTGEIRACDRLVVEGRVEAALTDSRSIEIASTGMFKGKAQIDTAEISGRFEGDLVVTQKLMIHSTGRVVGNIRYGQIEIAKGGIISGQIDVLPSSGAAEEESAAQESAGGSVVTASASQGEAEHN